MRTFLLTTIAGSLLAGCASTETGRVSTAPDGTRVYGLDEQPQATVTGEGALMPGAYTTHTLPTGQFTGQERSQAVIGQRPTPPRESDPRDLARSTTPATSGAGALGQVGVIPGENVTSQTLVDLPPNLAEVAASNTPASTHIAVGSGPTVERSTGNSTTNNSGGESKPELKTSNEQSAPPNAPVQREPSPARNSAQPKPETGVKQ